MKKFLVILVALGVAAAIAYLVFSRLREADPGGGEPEIDLREVADDAAGPHRMNAEVETAP